MIQTLHGYAYPSLKLQNKLVAGVFSAKSGSLAGNIVIFTGEGLANDTKDSELSINLDCGMSKYPLEVTAANPLTT